MSAKPDSGPPDAALAARYERTVRALRGRRITAVAYHPLREGGPAGAAADRVAGPAAVEAWDFDTWHLPTLGVVFALDDGSSALATWNRTFAGCGLEVSVSPTRAGLRDIAPAGGPAEVDASAHPRWAALLGQPLTAVDICWREAPLSDRRWPAAVRWEAAGGSVWTAAGAPVAWPFDGRFQLGTDDVLVVFDPGLAARAGLGGGRRRRGRVRAAT